MRIEYTTTPEQCEYLINRVIETTVPPSGPLQYLKKFVPITIAVVIGFAVFLRPSDPTVQLATCTVLLFAGLLILPWMDYRQRKTGIAKVREQMMRIISPGLFSVELESDGVRVSDDGTEVLHPWRKVTAVRDTDRFIEIDVNHALAIVIDHEATSDEVREAFLTTARARITGPEQP